MTDIPWGPTGRLVYERTYSRTKPDGAKETWPETVERVVDGNLALGGGKHVLPYEREDLIELMTKFKVLPAGRHLWASGVKGRQYLFNCHVAGWGDRVTDHFEFTFMRLMEGGGVGSNYSNRYLDQYPSFERRYAVHVVCDPEHPDYQKMVDAGVLSDEYNSDWEGAFEVEDSREGWASALVDLIDTYYREAKNTNRVFDVSRVRPEGTRLKTFGGHASGPLPLAVMLTEVSEIMNRNVGAWLDGISAMEIDHAIATCVVSGGNRRSARMAIMHWDDPQIVDFITCKTATDKHWTTNISVEVDDAFWGEADQGNAKALLILDRVSEAMLLNGEPGIWDSTMSNVEEPGEVVATNPCVTGDTEVMTVDGPRTFSWLAANGEDVQVHAWHPVTKRPVIRWMRNPRLTRRDVDVVEVTFDSGLKVRCTPDHNFYSFRGKKVAARDLNVGQAVRAWSMSQHRNGHLRVHGWNSERNKADHQWVHRMLVENDGPTVIPDGYVVDHINGDPTDNRRENLQVITEVEHNQKHYPDRHRNGFNGACPNHKVVSVEYVGKSDVYNGTVDDAHSYVIVDPEPVAGVASGVISANCGEIPLQAWENCNLGHVNLAAFVDPETAGVDLNGLIEAHRLMTRFLIRATHGDVNDPRQAEVLAKNRRIGVGHFGFASMAAKLGIEYSKTPAREEVRDLLHLLAAVVDEEAVHYAHDLRIPVPVKKRTVAPTGTIAKLPGVSEGIHPIFSQYFIRRIRFSNVNPDQVDAAAGYAQQGFQVEPCVYAPNTTVVAIPTKDSLLEEVEAIHGEAAEGIVESADQLSIIDMLRVQAMYQECWADNAVSFTANVDPNMYTPVGLANILRLFGRRVKGFTVFPEMSREQSPYERISKEEYLDSQSGVVEDGVDEDCASGACAVR